MPLKKDKWHSNLLNVIVPIRILLPLDVILLLQVLGNKLLLLPIFFAGDKLSMNTMQEANRLLSGERGYVRLRNMQKLLRVRQQYMISQVSLLYPVKVVIGHALEQELESFTSSFRLGMINFAWDTL